MKYREFYDSVKNPLADTETIDKILKSFSGKGGFYNALTRMQGEKVSNCYTIEDADYLALLLFQDWKESLLKGVINHRFAKKYEDQAILLVNYLRGCNPRNEKEVQAILDGNMTPSQKIKDAINKFRWTRVGEFSTFHHIDSSCVKFDSPNRQTIEHRLYVNTDSTKTHLFCAKFIEKCNERNLTYYFKFDDVGARDDSFVLYCDTKHLPVYVQIIEEVIRENHLEKNVHKPPILTGSIHDVIGYGSDPELYKGKPISYNDLRRTHLEMSIRTETVRWMKGSMNLKLHNGRQELLYSEYLLREIVREIRNKILQCHFPKSRKTGGNYYGLTRGDILSKEFEIAVYSAIRNHMNEIFNYFSGELRSISIDILYKDKAVPLWSNHLDDVLKRQVELFNRSSSEYKKCVQKKIQSTATSYGISPYHYAFDERGLQLLSRWEQEEICKADRNRSKSCEDAGMKTKVKKYHYVPMTDSEVEEARRRLGFQ